MPLLMLRKNNYMNDTTIEKRVENYPDLRNIAEDLLTFVVGMSTAIQYDISRDFDVISANFLLKQRQHLRSILALERNRDALLIMRTMIEGLVQLMYILRTDREKLSSRWRRFNIIESWRGMIAMKRMGHNITPEIQKGVEARKEAVSDEFLTDKARKILEKRQPLPPDPYVKKWLSISITEMFYNIKLDRADADKLYTAYDMGSSWHHWSQKGLAQAMTLGRNGEHGYAECHPLEYITALEAGVICLLQMAGSTNNYFLLKMEDQISSFQKRFTEYILTSG
jgi:hypothetical protein